MGSKPSVLVKRMMIFRRLYWVAEQVDLSGQSKVTGVFTSIQDLIYKGLHWCDGGTGYYRLTLLKPDSFNCPIGVFKSPQFQGLTKTLAVLVEGGEYSSTEVTDLEAALEQFVSVKAS